MGSATTKRDMVKRIAGETDVPRPLVRRIVQQFLDDVVDELAGGRRLEFRDFGVFEPVLRRPRVARNPRTGLTLQVPAKTVVHFKQGRLMKERVAALHERPPARTAAGAAGDTADTAGAETGRADTASARTDEGPERRTWGSSP